MLFVKILVLGGTGHVGSFLVPMLVKQGHYVYVGTRGKTGLKSYSSYEKVHFLSVDSKDRKDLEALKKYDFEVVVDMPGSAWDVWSVLSDSVEHIVACGSLWMFGKPVIVPTPEVKQGDCPFPTYAERFDKIQYMIEHSGEKKAVFTAIMPSNICGPGKVPLDCTLDRSIEAHKSHMAGDKVVLPDGPECIISPCDAEDIAQLFFRAIHNREASAGQIFNVGSKYGVTATRLVEIYSEIYGVNIPIERVSWDKYVNEISPGISWWWHLYAHMAPDISKAQRLLGYEPKYTPEQTLKRAVEWMQSEEML